MNKLQVAGTQISRDAEGRYCLNDLHRAAGGHEKHRPSKWLRNEQAKALIQELNNEVGSILRRPNNTVANVMQGKKEKNKDQIRAFSTTQKSGTFIVRELVYAYAMWISPAFNLRVIRAFDSIVNGEFIQPHIQHENYWFARRPHWPPIRLRVLAGECYRDIAAALQISRGRVARAVRGMIKVGLLAPLKVAEAQRGPAKRAALYHGQGWGLRQLSLFEEWQ